jgi:hypothetical protein
MLPDFHRLVHSMLPVVRRLVHPMLPVFPRLMHSQYIRNNIYDHLTFNIDQQNRKGNHKRKLVT